MIVPACLCRVLRNWLILQKFWKSEHRADNMNSAEKKFWCEFIDLYESMPCLWKVKSDEYSNRDLKNQCYSKMEEKMKEFDKDANREKVVRKINVFRTNYRRELKKKNKSEKSGAGADEIYEPTLWYFDRLAFLKEQECSTDGKCSMDNEVFVACNETVEKPMSKKRKELQEDNLLKLACQTLGKIDDDTCTLAKGWATQYKELTVEQQVFARTIFADVLFHGFLGKLSEQTVEDTHKVLKGVSFETRNTNLSGTSTPHSGFSEQTQSSSSAPQYEEPMFHSQQFARTLNRQYVSTPHSRANIGHPERSHSSSSDQFYEEVTIQPSQQFPARTLNRQYTSTPTPQFIQRSLDNSEIYFKPVEITNVEVLPTERMEPSQSIAEFLNNFVDE